MADNRYYWIKLRTDFFDEKKIDFLMSQKNGSDYVVLYQMLCLKVANSDGILATNINEVMIPFDIDKITRDTKYFNKDTVLVAMELYKKLGLIFQEEEKGLLCINNFEELVGSECSSAKRVREFREKQELLQCNTDVTQEIRDKSIDIKSIKNIDNIEKNIKKEILKDELQEVLETYSFSEKMLIAINKWLAYKKEKKNAYKPIGFKMLLDKLKKELETRNEQEVIEAIENCMAKNYQGIFFQNKPQVKPIENSKFNKNFNT